MARKKKAEVVTKKNDAKFFASQVEGIEDASVFEAETIEDPNPNSTGSFSLDYDLTVPAPEGRYVEIVGDEGSGKTTLALEIAGQALRQGKYVLYVDLEFSVSKSLMSTIRTLKAYFDSEESGERLQVLQAPNGETALEAARMFASQFPNCVIIIDSVDALLPEAVLGAKIGEKKVGNLPQLMSDGLRKMLRVCHENHALVVFINQFRTKIEKFQMGDPRVPSGGMALGFYASQRVKLMKPGKAQLITDDDGEVIGHVVRYTVFKNKCAPFPVSGEFPILYYNGIFREQELVTMCVNFGILDLGGRGGKQILLPKIKDGQPHGDPTPMKRLNANKRLMLDRALYEYLEHELNQLLKHSNSQEAVESYLAMDEDEVSDS